jgi:hypothetical protein
MKTYSFLIVVGALSASSLLQADTTYMVTHLETFYRITVSDETGGMTVETFDLGRRVRAMHYNAAEGVVFGIAGTGTGASDLLIVENAVSGVPSLSHYASLELIYGGMTRIGDGFYGFADGGDLFSIDVSTPSNPIETRIGPTGVTGMGALAYDPVGEVFYGVSKLTERLYAIDPTNAGLAAIGHVGISPADGGGEWFDNRMFMSMNNLDSGDFELGTVDVLTGLYTSMFAIEEGAAGFSGTGLAIVPEPATLMSLGALALLVPMRRR